MARYGSGGFALSDLVGGTARGFASMAAYAEVTAWYAQHPLSGAQLDLAQALESIGGRAQWRESAMAEACAVLSALAAGQ